MRVKSVSGLLFLSLLLGMSQAQGETLIGEQFAIAAPTTSQQSIGVVIDDSQFIKNQFAHLQAFTADGPEGKGKVLTVTQCQKIGTPGCEEDKFFLYKAFIGYCKTIESTDCISTITATTSDGKVHEGTFVEDFPGTTQYSFDGSRELNLPTGSSSFIVDIATAPHSQGSKYLVISGLDGRKGLGEKTFKIDTFRTGIFAVTTVTGSYNPPRSLTSPSNFEFLGVPAFQRVPGDNTSGGIAKCAQTTTTRCALAWPLPLDVDFALTMKLKTKVEGWLHGRLRDVGASIENSTSGNQVLRITGKPVNVPIVYAWFPLATAPKAVLDYYATDPRILTAGTSFGAAGTPQASILKDYIDYQERSFPEALAWYTGLGDTAPHAGTAWSFSSVENKYIKGNCTTSSDSLSGIVTTNSNMFVAQPPTFNTADQTLDYKVASPHFLPDGSVFKGSYNLSIRSEFARCIYGFTKAPIAASVSILSSDGTSQVATTVISERNGWITLAAEGFTFSSPTLKVKFSQAAEPVVTPSPTATPSPSASAKAATPKKTTITCVKGKTTKKVTAIKPTCPTGYKKK
jgi:hypothetical protein